MAQQSLSKPNKSQKGVAKLNKLSPAEKSLPGLSRAHQEPSRTERSLPGPRRQHQKLAGARRACQG
eukprot:1734594-Pyramimonas_sp.AAC.1